MFSNHMTKYIYSSKQHQSKGISESIIMPSPPQRGSSRKEYDAESATAALGLGFWCHLFPGCMTADKPFDHPEP